MTRFSIVVISAANWQFICHFFLREVIAALSVPSLKWLSLGVQRDSETQKSGRQGCWNFLVPQGTWLLLLVSFVQRLSKLLKWLS